MVRHEFGYDDITHVTMVILLTIMQRIAKCSDNFIDILEKLK